MSQIFSLLLSRGLWNFFGLVALALLIWIAGPLLAIGATRPLEPERHRIILIAVIFGIWLLRLIWRRWRQGRLNAHLLGQLRRPATKTDAPAPTEDGSGLAALQAQFDEAIELLRKTRFGTGRSGRIRARFSRQYLYQLPWYVFVGAPGSGKTTALVNSGLEFPLAERFGRTALRGVGGTRNCDWWFTNDAVLLDTAGRYTTQESNPVGDEKEWHGFLKLLSRSRGRQPINGAILTVSVADLLSTSDAERVQHAVVLRRRLQELHEQLGIDFPIYVLVTKMDLLSGFEAYFNTLSREERAQVWGFTFPFAETLTPEFDLFDRFHAEYQLLVERLDAAVPDVLANETDPNQRAQAYLLPQQFAGLQAMLAHFLSDVFGASRFEARLWPRGVYFTSGIQGGADTFDPVTGQLRRYLRIDGNGQPTERRGAEGRSYFLKHLLQEVIFRESGLAGRNHRWERRYRQLHWAGYTLGALILAGLLLGWGISYRNNSAYVAEIESRLPVVSAQAKELKVRDDGEVLNLMGFLDLLRHLPESADFALDDPPLTYRFGLYQGRKLESAANGLYRKVLDQVLAPQAARRVEAALRQAPDDDLEYRYEALRAYLMLHDSQRYDGDFMHAWLLSDLQRGLPAGYTREQYDRLSGHLRALTDQQILVSPFPLDEGLVQRTREALASYPLDARAYSRLHRLLQREQLPEQTVMTLAGPQAPSVLKRTSGQPLTQGVPGIFSYTGYWDAVDPRIEPVVSGLLEDDRWILDVDGAARRDGDARATVAAQVRQRYLNDYIRNWDDYLNDITLAPARSLLENIQMARTLSAPDSPLIRLVQGVAQQTTLLREATEDDATRLLNQARERVSGTRNALEQMFGPVGPGSTQRVARAEQRPEQLVDQHFEPYRRLASGATEGAPPQITATTSLINELYTYLTAADAALRSASPAPNSDVATKLQAEAGRMPGPLRGMLTTLSVNAMGDVAERVQQNLGQNVSATIGQFCRQAIAGRYPFSRTATRDVAPNDLARLFGPGGMMDTFFQEQLMPHVDMSGSRWRFKPGIDGAQGRDARFLASFQQAAVIRDVYFATGERTPRIELSIRPLQMDAELNQVLLDIDGQLVRYAHGPQVASTVRWPGTRGSQQVSLEATPQGGSGIRATGPWALHRLLDRARLQPTDSPDRLHAYFTLNGHEVVFEISANSVKNPFRLPDMEAFSCPGAV